MSLPSHSANIVSLQRHAICALMTFLRWLARCEGALYLRLVWDNSVMGRMEADTDRKATETN